MRGSWIVVVAVLWSRAQADTCVDRADAMAKYEAARQAADASYQKALAAKKMKPIGMATVPLQSGDQDYVSADFKQYVVKNGVITDIQGSCGGPSGEFVQQGTKVFRVERKPKKRAVRIETCQCTYANVGGCGLRATARAVGHVLPSGTTYGGTVTIEYAVDDVELTHAQPCPPPQPVP